MTINTKYKDFVVLRGIEYDTRDAGHFIVVMPDDLYLKVLTIRGMRLARLIQPNRPGLTI